RRFGGSWVFNGRQVEWSEGTVDPSAMAKFTEEFVGLFLFVQMSAIVLLTPAFTAGAVAEGRQRRPLGWLLTTHPTAAQIVLGKFAARLAHLFGVLLTGLPILALLPLWGGVAPGRIVDGFALTALTTVSLSALSIWLSVRSRTTRGAMAATYALAATACFCPFCLCASPFAALLAVVDPGSGMMLDFLPRIAITT